jgi:hypothetical protein
MASRQGVRTSRKAIVSTLEVDVREGTQNQKPIDPTVLDADLQASYAPIELEEIRTALSELMNF